MTDPIEDLARLIDPEVWAAREEDQKTIGTQWVFKTRREFSLSAAERVAGAGYAKRPPAQ